ncbi:unnamed protein product [Didymodactylos carnosus]|uniref:Uncharacterized protein n=1 Tax=Didymodactylos carnosus TaxID=1234261 RepID=A0A815HTW8_9BILA|nr:unnamed protein product [Didymodactylos carnosus]CAF4234544.1 unnamed protein product [Didymodactylos carnosus]
MVESTLLSIVLLDSDIIQSDDCRDALTHLNSCISCVNTFVNVDQCIDYIKSRSISEKVHFIISGSYAENIINLSIFNIPQIHTVYIHCKNTAKYQYLLELCPNLDGIYDNKSYLLTSLIRSMNDREPHSTFIKIINPDFYQQNNIRNLNKDTETFVWFQLLIHLLLRTEQTQESKMEMLNFCRQYYKVIL